MAERVHKTLDALHQHGFDTQYFAKGAEAAEWLVAQVPAGASAGRGGSATLNQLGLLERLRAKGVTIPDPWSDDLDDEQKRLAYRDAQYSDAFFCSANAITETGSILNVDGTGNRITAMACGPRHLYIVAGINKLVPDEAAAFERIKQCAPLNCQRLGLETPCAKTGRCHDCRGEARSCRAYLLLRYPARFVPTTVVLIGEELGF